MKILTLSFLLISFSFSQEPINYENRLIEKDYSFYTKDTNKPYSGPVFSLYEDGKKKEKGSLKKGKMISKTKWKWYENGQMWSEENFKDGKVDGTFTFWYENGQKNYEQNYKDGIKIGLWRSWFENGQKNYEIIYKDDKRDGLLTTWYEDGQKSSEGTFKDGIPDGLEMYWYENGQKYRELTYYNGELINEIYWTEDGLDYGEFVFYFIDRWICDSSEFLHIEEGYSEFFTKEHIAKSLRVSLEDLDEMNKGKLPNRRSIFEY